MAKIFCRKVAGFYCKVTIFVFFPGIIEKESIPRNIKIAEIFKEAFLIERYGSGIKRAVKELTNYKLPVPKIVETVGGIEIVIYGTPQEKKDPHNISTQKEKQSLKNGGIKESGGLNILFDYIKKNPGKRISEISSILQIPESTLEKQAKKLKDLKKITYKGSKKRGGYYLMENDAR